MYSLDATPSLLTRHRAPLLALLLFACGDAAAPPDEQGWSFRGLSGVWVKRLAHSQGWLFAGTSNGVYRTALHDTSATWSPLGLQGDTIEAMLVLSPDTLFASRV